MSAYMAGLIATQEPVKFTVGSVVVAPFVGTVTKIVADWFGQLDRSAVVPDQLITQYEGVPEL